jgi:hypothetical protein
MPFAESEKAQDSIWALRVSRLAAIEDLQRAILGKLWRLLIVNERKGMHKFPHPLRVNRVGMSVAVSPEIELHLVGFFGIQIEIALRGAALIPLAYPSAQSRNLSSKSSETFRNSPNASQ